MPVRQFLVFYFADISFFHGTLSLYDIRHCSGLVNWPFDIQLFHSPMKSLSTWYIVFFLPVRVFPAIFVCFYSFFGGSGVSPWVLVESSFSPRWRVQFRLRIGDYIVMIHTFIRGFRISLDAAWIEIICFIGLVILVWIVVLVVFKTQTHRISLCHHFFLFMH